MLVKSIKRIRPKNRSNVGLKIVKTSLNMRNNGADTNDWEAKERDVEADMWNVEPNKRPNSIAMRFVEPKKWLDRFAETLVGTDRSFCGIKITPVDTTVMAVLVCKWNIGQKKTDVLLADTPVPLPKGVVVFADISDAQKKVVDDFKKVLACLKILVGAKKERGVWVQIASVSLLETTVAQADPKIGTKKTSAIKFITEVSMRLWVLRGDMLCNFFMVLLLCAVFLKVICYAISCFYLDFPNFYEEIVGFWDVFRGFV